jgi:DNA topoisomerase-3
VPDLKSDASPDGFKLGKTILQQSLDLDSVKALFATGKTPLMKGFISKRTKRPFKAHLTFDEKTGKIGFEFPANGKFKSKKK